MANNAVLKNNSPTQSVGHFLPPAGVNVWDGSRRLQLGIISRLIGSNITLNPTNNTILLQPGIYKLTGCWQIGFATGQATIKWYNETTSSFFGQDLFIPTVDNNSNWNTSNILIETISVTSPTSVSIRDTGSGTTQPTSTRSYVIIEQLNIQLNTTQNNVTTVSLSANGIFTIDNIRFQFVSGEGFRLATVTGTVSSRLSVIAFYNANLILGRNESSTLTTTLTHPFDFNTLTSNSEGIILYLIDNTNDKAYKFEMIIGVSPLSTILTCTTLR
jgi:hypothetical protein